MDALLYKIVCLVCIAVTTCHVYFVHVHLLPELRFAQNLAGTLAGLWVTVQEEERQRIQDEEDDEEAVATQAEQHRLRRRKHTVDN